MPYKNAAEHAQYQLARQKRLRAEWIAANGPCRSCGAWDEEMHVDHVDPAEKVSHRIWSWGAVRRAMELEKCQPLCRVCHKAKTAVEMSRPLVHGTISGYRHRGCRCVECRLAHSRNTNLVAGAGVEPATSPL